MAVVWSLAQLQGGSGMVSSRGRCQGGLEGEVEVSPFIYSEGGDQRRVCVLKRRATCVWRFNKQLASIQHTRVSGQSLQFP